MRSRPLFMFVIASALGACGDNREPSRQPDGGPPGPDAGTEIPLQRAHAGGSPTAIELAGTRAFVGVGPRLAIWELSTTPPSLVGESEPLRGVVSALAIAGTHVYVAERVDLDSQIHVFDASTPAAPVEVATLSVGAPGATSVIRDLEIASGRLYVADQEQGIVEVDLTNPAAPAIVRLVAMPGVSSLTTAGDRLYYTAESFFGGASAGALDLANALADLGASSLGNVNGLAFTGMLAIGAGPDGIYVYDLTDPTNPQERFHHGDFGAGPFARAITARGSSAWIPADDGLHVLDLADTSNIAHTGPANVPTANVNATASSASAVAIVTDRGRLVAIDLAGTEPRAPQVVDVTLCADCVSVAGKGATLYIADIVGGVRAATLSALASIGRSPALPVVPDTGGLQFVFEDIDIGYPYAYVADWLHGLRIFDVSTPQLVHVGSIATGGAPAAVRVVGNRAYLTESTNGGSLKILDVTDPAHPTVLGGIETSKAMEVEVRGNLAYVADESLFAPGGLRIFDVANPTAIAPLGVYNDGCLFASDVALAGNLALVACNSDGLHWVDISNPNNPVRVAITETAHETGSVTAVATWDGHVVIGHDRGVIVMRTDTPETVATFATAWPVRSLAVPAPGRIVAATGPGGVYQWKVETP